MSHKEFMEQICILCLRKMNFFLVSVTIVNPYYLWSNLVLSNTGTYIFDGFEP